MFPYILKKAESIYPDVISITPKKAKSRFLSSWTVPKEDAFDLNQNEVYGSNVSTYDFIDSKIQDKRRAQMAALIKKRRRPDARDMEYDKGRIKKVKKAKWIVGDV